MSNVPRWSTRQIVADNQGLKRLGHNPSWVKASDFDALEEAHKQLADLFRGLIRIDHGQKPDNT